jgi:hypothetical protein
VPVPTLNGQCPEEIPVKEWHVGRPPIGDLVSRTSPAQDLALAYRAHGYTMKEIAGQIGRHYVTVSRRIAAWERGEMS